MKRGDEQIGIARPFDIAPEGAVSTNASDMGIESRLIANVAKCKRWFRRLARKRGDNCK